MYETAYDKWKSRYEKNWATKSQLKTLVGLEVLTATEYEQITGEPYQA